MRERSRPYELVRPVVIQAGGIGDMVMVTPLLACLHARFGKAPFLACSHNGVPEDLFVGEHPHLSGMMRVGGWKRHYYFVPRQWKFVDYLRHSDAGPIYICDARRDKVTDLLKRAGVSPERCVFSYDYPQEMGMNRYRRFLALGHHTPPAYQTAAIAAVTTDQDFRPCLHIRTCDREDLEDWLRRRGLSAERLVLLRPCTRSDKDGKSWPAQNWSALCQAVQAYTPGIRFLLTAAPHEADLVSTIRSQLGVEVDVAAEDLPLRRLLALQERAFAMISVDTGPSHTAAALGCPVMIFYAKARPEEYEPMQGLRAPAHPQAGYSPVVALKASPTSQNAKDISVESAFEGWKRLMTNMPSERRD